MSKSINVLILSLSLCLSSEVIAQGYYTFMRRGQISTYDSSVNIHIKEYRLIRAKILTADTLVNSLNAEIKNMQLLSIRKDSAAHLQTIMLEINSRVIEGDKETIKKLSESFDKLFQVRERKKKIYERPGVVFGVGGIAGIILKTLLAK